MPTFRPHFPVSFTRPLTLVFAVISGVVGAQTTTSFEPELEAYLTRAQNANPSLLAYTARHEAARARIPQSRALPDPMLQVSHFVESVQTRTGPQRNIIMLGQRLPWFGKLRERGERANREADALWHALQARQLTLARDVSSLFFEYGFTARAITLTTANRDLLRELEEVVKQKVAAGADLNELLRLSVELGRTEDQLASLNQQRHAQSAQLAALLALDETGPLPLPQLSEPEAREFDRTALNHALTENNPDLATLRLRIASADAARELARLEAFPDVTVGVNYIQIDSPTVNPTTPDAGRDPWALTLAVNLPLWRDRTAAARDEARASHRAAEHELDDQLNRLRGELTAALARHDDAQRRLKVYGTDLLGLAEQALQNSRSAYESARVGILEVIDSERSLLDLQLQHWRAATDVWQQRIAIQSLANLPLTEAIDSSREP